MGDLPSFGNPTFDYFEWNIYAFDSLKKLYITEAYYLIILDIVHLLNTY